MLNVAVDTSEPRVSNTMSDRRFGIPAWQRNEAQETTRKDTEEIDKLENQEKASRDDAAQGSPSDQEIETSSELALDKEHLEEHGEDRKATGKQHAAKFLEDPAIRDAPLVKKLEFLKLKGLSEESIAKSKHLLESSEMDKHGSTSIEGTLQPRQVAPPSSMLSEPPIITYPEHLLNPQKPPPLITSTGLLNATYAFAGLAATSYGVSNYLVKPMTESLAASRHDFYLHTQSKLDNIIQRLEENVTQDPKKDALQSDGVQGATGTTDTASEDSDPTELFHRDFGTQTSAEDFPKGSKSQNPSNSDRPDTITEAHQQQINQIKAAVAGLTSDGLSSESQTIQELRVIMEMSREQLESLAYPASVDGGSFGWTNNDAGFSNLYSSTNKKDSDEISKMKQEIRSLKGSLLSAKSFPAANNARKDPSIVPGAEAAK